MHCNPNTTCPNSSSIRLNPMRQYPFWLLLLLAPTILVPVGTLVFFLFGNVTLWPESDSTVLNIMQYILIQLFWIGPIISFFVSLFFWGWARQRASIFAAIGGLFLTAGSILVLALQ